MNLSITSNRLLCDVCAITFLLANSLAFASDNYQPPITIINESRLITVYADGSNDEIYERQDRIETEQAADSFSKVSMSYNSTLEKCKVMEAYTIRPDGKRIKVAHNGIKVMSDPISDGAPMFSDTKHLVIVFPNVEKGSQIYFKTKSTHTKPQYLGHFSFEDLMIPQLPYQNATIELRHDPRIHIRVQATGMLGGQVEDVSGMKRYIYSYKNDKAFPSESGQVSIFDFAPQFQASNFSSYEELGRIYDQNAKGNEVVTPKISKQANEITNGIADKREQAKAIYNWVSRNIRYVSVDLGNGGLVPHKADIILSNRYGDCKDHATLLKALLKSKQIESTQVLIQTDDRYKIADVPVISAFNHVINYIPELDVYLDSTEQYAPFGTLPEVDTDKPVVLTGLGRVSRTPLLTPEDNQIIVNTNLVMQPDGNIKGKSTYLASGFREIDNREKYESLLAEPTERAVKEILRGNLETGVGDFHASNPADLSVPFEVNSEFTLDAPANVPGPGALVIPVGIAPGFFTGFASFRPIETRLYSYLCKSNKVVENTVLVMLPNLKIEVIPKDVMIKGQEISYSASYKLDSNTITISRNYEKQCSKSYSEPSIHEKDKQFYKELQKDIRSQVIFR